MASKLDPKRATQLQWFHGSVRCDRMKMTTIMTAVVDPKVSRNMEKLVKLMILHRKARKKQPISGKNFEIGWLWGLWSPGGQVTNGNRLRIWCCQVPKLVECCFPGQKGDGWVWELLGTHNFLSLQA